MTSDQQSKQEQSAGVGERMGAALDNLRGVRESLTGRRVFGEAYELDGLTVIPVARVRGMAGGGGGEGIKEGETGGGFGTGFGLQANPVGVFEIHDDNVTWRPAVDVTQLVKGTQVLTGIVAVCVTLGYLRGRTGGR